jgi:sugar fermentation stimulation protein A
MKSCADPGSKVWLLPSHDPKRKLPFTWELTECQDGFIGINTVRSNSIVEEGLRNHIVEELTGYTHIRREVPYGERSRCDFLLSNENSGNGQVNNRQRCWVEVKNVTLLLDGAVQFPDTVTERGLKHLDELLAMRKNGDRAVVFFLVNRMENVQFRPAERIDSKFAEKLREVAKFGVEVLAYRTNASKYGIQMADRVDVVLG